MIHGCSMLVATFIVNLGYVTQALELYTILWDRGKTIMYNIKKISLMFLVTLLLEVLLTGCANLRVGLLLLQHATGPYDPMDQVMEDRLNAILEAAVAQDAAAIKAQFAPNAIAAQPELDDQIEALLAYYNIETWEFEIPATGISESRNETGGTTRSYEMHSRIDGEKYYLVAMHAVVNDTTEPDNVGIWSLFLFRTDYPIESAYYVKDEDNMVGIYVDLLPRQLQY